MFQTGWKIKGGVVCLRQGIISSMVWGEMGSNRQNEYFRNGMRYAYSVIERKCEWQRNRLLEIVLWKQKISTMWERRSISLYYDVFKEKMIKFRYVDGGSGKNGRERKEKENFDILPVNIRIRNFFYSDSSPTRLSRMIICIFLKFN